MRRDELEHLIRAAAAISGEREIVIVGAAAILGSAPDAPPELRRTLDADLYPRNRPELAEVIDGAIGELSPFHETFGFYAHGVGPETAVLPDGWEDRLVRIQNAATDQNVGWCLEPHDLAASKLVAGREKDREFVRSLLRHRLVQPGTVRDRVGALPLPPERKAELQSWVDREANPQPR
jgi:hypothetical protein